MTASKFMSGSSRCYINSACSTAGKTEVQQHSAKRGLPLRGGVCETPKKGAPETQKPFNRAVPLPLGCGVCETNSKKGRARDRKPLMHGYTALRGGLRPRSWRGPDHGIGVDPSLLKHCGTKTQTRFRQMSICLEVVA